MNVGRGIYRLSMLATAVEAIVMAVLAYGLAQWPDRVVRPTAIGVGLSFAILAWGFTQPVEEKKLLRSTAVVFLSLVFIPFVANWSVDHVAADATWGLMLMVGAAPLGAAVAIVLVGLLVMKSLGFVAAGFKSQ